jgi:putative oxidoreductase
MQEPEKRMAREGWALVPLRMMLGLGFAAHGLAKLGRGPEQFAGALAGLGIPMPSFASWATTLLELIGGVSLMAGAFVTPVSLPLAVVMLTALLSVHLPYGFSSIKLQSVTSAGVKFGEPGIELNLLYLAGLLALVLGGPSPASVDAWLRRRRS